MDRQVTYNKLKQATLLIRSGLPFIGTNPDRTFPTPQGLVPGSGAILAALEAATDQTPLILGKPSPEMYQVAMERMSVRPENTLVIGDRLETDIVGAQRLGCLTALCFLVLPRLRQQTPGAPLRIGLPAIWQP